MMKVIPAFFNLQAAERKLAPYWATGNRSFTGTPAIGSLVGGAGVNCCWESATFNGGSTFAGHWSSL
jgi:hypothetical protein